jgi:hypothetical protein
MNLVINVIKLRYLSPMTRLDKPELFAQTSLPVQDHVLLNFFVRNLWVFAMT